MPPKPRKTEKNPPSQASGGKPATKPRRVVAGIEDRIPSMTDSEIQSLHANAERLAASGSEQQQAEALRLMPAIMAEVEARAAVRAAALEAKRTAQREARASKARR